MTARGRLNSYTDWDPMKDDYNNTLYDAQYTDNDTNGRSGRTYPLDHRKLYVTNLPPGLSEQGLKTAFDKYGQVEQVFLSRDPTKKYAIITYETAAEARVAMMKLNRTEPLHLNVNLAHARSRGQNSNDTQNFNGSKDRGQKDSGSYVSSCKERTFRDPDEQANGEMELEEAMVLPMDREFHIKMEQIKLEKLRLQEEQLKCKQKMMMLQMEKRPMSITNTATGISSRRLLPDGRIIVQNQVEKMQEPDSSDTAGAGDSSETKLCIVCGAYADLYCSRCHVAPYCSAQCQHIDWNTRHNTVCHNLIRLQPAGTAQAAEPLKPETVVNQVPSPPAALRRPHSSDDRGRPQRDRGQPAANVNKDKTHFFPRDHHPQPGRNNQRAPTNRDNNQDGRRPQRQNNNQDDEDRTKERGGANNQYNNIQNGRRPQRQTRNNNQDNEDWGTTKKKAAKRPELKTRAAEPKIPSLLKLKVEKPEAVQSDSSKFNDRMGATLTEPKVDQPVALPKEVALVPQQYIVDKLPIGETFLVSVEFPAQDCATKQPGFVCLAIHSEYMDQYNMLLMDIFENERSFKPQPGDTFAYLDAADGGWYRARCLSSTRCALLDSGNVAPLSAEDQCRPLAKEIMSIPEFCCVLNGNVKIAMSLKCTILMKTTDGYNVSIEDSTQDNYLGEAIVTRWMPEVDLGTSAQPIQEKTPPIRAEPRREKSQTAVASQPRQQKAKPAPKVTKPPTQPAKPANTPPQNPPRAKSQALEIPSVPRPPISGGSRYFLLHVTSLARACVRACDAVAAAEFESVLQDTALCGLQKSTQLTEPPLPGQLVLSLFEGVHYRALVLRTKAADNRYKIEYLEYGNEEVVPLDKLFSCPPELDLSSRPTQASIVALSSIASNELTAPATEYLETVKEQAELIATIPGGEKTAPSGSLVQLALDKNKESVNRKLEEMCMPEWKKLEENSRGVMEEAYNYKVLSSTDSEVLMYAAMKTLPLPTNRPFVLDITDFGNIQSGVLCGFDRGAAKEAEYVFGQLTDKINEYCNSELCKEPYLPVMEELCLAKLPPYPQWFRAVVMQHGAGRPGAAVLCVDYGSVEAVPVAHLRKMMPEFCRQPALAATLDVKDWPEHASNEQIVRAIEFLKINEEGRGELLVKRAKKMGDDLGYEIEVPELIAAINAV